MRDVATEDFSLRYDGPALVEGRMPVRDLAPAMLALGELFQRAQEIIDPESPPVHLEVRAFNDGSVEAALSAVTDEAIKVLTSDPVVALGILMSLVTDSGRGIFAALRVLRGKIARAEPLPDGDTRVEDNHGNVFIASNMTVNVLKDNAARNAAAAAVKPLREEGIEEMRIERRNEQPLVVTNEVVETIDQWEIEESEEEGPQPVIDQTMQAVVIPLTPTLDERYMARFQIAGSDQIVRAKIVDEGYWRKLHNHEEYFFEGDTMRVTLRMRQYAPETKKPIEWAVEKVLRHSHPQTRAMTLPFEDEQQTRTEPPPELPPSSE